MDYVAAHDLFLCRITDTPTHTEVRVLCPVLAVQVPSSLIETRFVSAKFPKLTATELSAQHNVHVLHRMQIDAADFAHEDQTVEVVHEIVSRPT